MPLHNVYKPLGQTPLEALTAFKNRKKLKGSFTYAGRLDPMAEGVLLLLSGKHIKNKEKYLALPKTYQATVLLGFSTDTYDLLGLVKKGSNTIVGKIIIQTLRSFIGKSTFTVPAFSSVPIHGKPSFEWAKEGKAKRNKRIMQIYHISNIRFSKTTKERLTKYLETNITRVSGDFRQKQILRRWDKVLKKEKDAFFTLVRLQVRCASGTYIRSIAHELGERLGGGAVLFSLKRTAVGRFRAENSSR